MQHLRARIGGALTAVALATTGGVLAAPVAAQAADDKPAYFEFTDHSGKTFVFKLTDEKKIAHARSVLAGMEKDEIHLVGRIQKRTADYNAGWGYHLDPDTISFFSMAIEVCDSTISYTQDYLYEAGGAFLPGLFWCPWSSRLTREVKF